MHDIPNADAENRKKKWNPQMQCALTALYFNNSLFDQLDS